LSYTNEEDKVEILNQKDVEMNLSDVEFFKNYINNLK
jgi:hypothetical protein